MPWYLKLVIGIVTGFITVKLYYTIGFIVLQSKAKNEALSIITAYQNPIKFDDTLVYSYSFLFCFIVICTLLPFVIPCGVHIYLKDSMKNISERNSEKRFLKFIVITLLYLFIFFSLLWGVLISVPYLAYIMLYKSKDASLLELIIRRIMGQITSIPNIVLLNVEYLNSQIKYSLIIEVWMLLVPILLLIGMKILSNKRKGRLSKLLFNILSPIVSFFILFVLLTHTFYITGYFGKSISNFDMDYVKVEFDLNGVQSIEGIRVFENKNEIIIRDVCNITHNIISEKIHVTSISEFSISCKNAELVSP